MFLQRLIKETKRKEKKGGEGDILQRGPREITAPLATLWLRSKAVATQHRLVLRAGRVQGRAHSLKVGDFAAHNPQNWQNEYKVQTF